MNCRKCGCLILETDERCPMCEAKQHRGKRKRRKSQIESDEIYVESSEIRTEKEVLAKVERDIELEKEGDLLQLATIHEEKEIRAEKRETIARFVDGMIACLAVPFILLAFIFIFTTVNPRSDHTFQSGFSLFIIILSLGAMPILWVTSRKKKRIAMRSDNKAKEELLQLDEIRDSVITEELMVILHERKEIRAKKSERIAKLVDGMIICLTIPIFLVATTGILAIMNPGSHHTFQSEFPMILVVLALGAMPIWLVVFRRKNRNIEKVVRQKEAIASLNRVRELAHEVLCGIVNE